MEIGIVSKFDRYRTVEPVSDELEKYGNPTALVEVATESHVAEVFVAPPPRQRVAPEDTVRVPETPGPVIVALALNTPWETFILLLIVKATPLFTTVAGELCVSV